MSVSSRSGTPSEALSDTLAKLYDQVEDASPNEPVDRPSVQDSPGSVAGTSSEAADPDSPRTMDMERQSEGLLNSTDQDMDSNADEESNPPETGKPEEDPSEEKNLEWFLSGTQPDFKPPGMDDLLGVYTHLSGKQALPPRVTSALTLLAKQDVSWAIVVDGQVASAALHKNQFPLTFVTYQRTGLHRHQSNSPQEEVALILLDEPRSK